MWERRLGVASLLAMGVLLGSGTGAVASEQFKGILHGGVVATGNSLGLSKANNANEPGILDSVGAFMAEGTALQDGAYPIGTTGDWTQNRSSAVLGLPAGATVVHAELIWGGSFQYGGEDVTSMLDSAVAFRHGAGGNLLVNPDPTTSVNLSGTAGDGSSQYRYYTRSADVTAFVAPRGAGTYSLGGVPATQSNTSNTANAAGWTLAVAYRRDASPMRWVALRATSGFVEEFSPVDEAMQGFCTPEDSSLNGALVASALEGDANRTGDELLAGADTSDLEVLAGVNNPANNFFASQINGSDGAIDATGTFGSINHDADSALNVLGGRQGWDVTTVPLSDQLANGQSTLLIRAASSSDSYVPTMVGAQIDVDSPNLAATGGSLAPTSIKAGESVTLTVPVTNVGGEVTAKDVSLKMALPAGVSVSAFTIDDAPGDASGSPVTVAGLAAGAKLGDIPVGATRTVEIVGKATSVGSFELTPEIGYTWQMCSESEDSLGGTLTAPTRGFTVTEAMDPPDPPDTKAPQTTITTKPSRRSTKPRVRFKFKSSEQGSRFECSLDKAKFRPCKSPKTLRAARGKHRFRVRAIDASGNSDATPAAWRFQIVKKRK